MATVEGGAWPPRCGVLRGRRLLLLLLFLLLLLGTLVVCPTPAPLDTLRVAAAAASGGCAVPSAASQYEAARLRSPLPVTATVALPSLAADRCGVGAGDRSDADRRAELIILAVEVNLKGGYVGSCRYRAEGVKLAATHSSTGQQG